MKRKIKEWYKLDNAAKIFPPTTDKYDPKTFRFAVALKENVDAKLLNKAIKLTIKEYPIFSSVLKKGLFWYYLEETDIPIKAIKENSIPCDYMEEDSLLFKVLYYNKRISLEVSHSLTDGTGALEFLKSLVTNYLQTKYEITEITNVNTSSISEKSSDSFSKYYKISVKNINPQTSGYKIKGRIYSENRIKIIEGIMPTSSLLKLSKEYNTTLTIYLTSILIESIGKNMSLRERKKPIYITIPVNLRTYFPSSTVRNFFNTISVSYRYQDNTSLEDIISSISNQFHNNLNKEALNKQMNSMAIFENIFIIRLIPVFIKDIVLKYIYKITRKYHTITLSNMGVIKIDDRLDKYIDYFDLFASTDGKQACMCSYKDKLVVSFTSHFINTEIEKNFFRSLSNKKIDVLINTNIVEEDDYDEEM